MVYDVTMLEAFYAAYKGKVEHVRAILKRPLTLAEKILYAHLYDVVIAPHTLSEQDQAEGHDRHAAHHAVWLCRMQLRRWLCFNL